MSTEPAPIRILLVDGSALTLAATQRVLERVPGFKVIGTAANGWEALQRIPQLEPTIVCAELHMPVMDGLEMTRAIMERFPRPILIFTTTLPSGKAPNVFPVLEAGAVDFILKPALREEDSAGWEDLIRRLRLSAGVHVMRRYPRPRVSEVKPAAMPAASRIVAMGASTGGPQALRKILAELPTEFPLPILCVQHLGEGFLEGLMSWLQRTCKLQLELAAGQLPQPGRVYFPPERFHLEVQSNGALGVSGAALWEGHRPSINLLFRSVAASFGAGAVGVLLTGMGEDGAEGLVAIRAAGGFTIAQDEASCVIFGMPQQAILRGAAMRIVSLDAMATVLLQCSRRKTAEPGR